MPLPDASPWVSSVNILGITGFIHNSSASLLQDGCVVAAAAEERFTRKKYTGAFPEQAIRYCLGEAGITIGDLQHVAFYWNPLRAIVPRVFQLVRNLPHSLAFFEKEYEPVQTVRGDFAAWLNMIMVSRTLRRSFECPEARFRRHYVDHHLGHAASCYYLSPWDDALILSIDGTGEWGTTFMARGRGQRIEPLSTVTYPHSLGVLYGAATQYLGYRVYQDEWKVMGLASYGRPRYADEVRSLVQCLPNGRFRLNLEGFHFQYADKRTWYSPKFVELFGPPPDPEAPVEKQERFADLAASFQLVTEEVILHAVRHLLGVGGGSRKLCLAGGVALNAVANGRILEETEVDEIFVQPDAADSGAGLGAALYVHNALLGGQRTPALEHVYLGPQYDSAQIRQALESAGLIFRECTDIATQCARRLAEGKIVGWFQGRMEYGPRALGNRSILADPRRAEMKDIVNAKVKFREGYRPFAPSILAERVGEFFVSDMPAPFMTLTREVRRERRDVIPAVTHVDGTARLQTVSERVNPRYHALIREFEKETGVPVLLNTSFNLQGEPIVCAPEDAVRTYLASGIDVLAIGDFLSEK